MRIEKFTAAELQEFLESERFRSMPFLPVSPHRAASWLNNPRLEMGDNILYLGFEGEDMIAYRSILPDRHEDIRFGWFSGNWVRPDQRRKGLSSRLFEEVYRDWGHQLMYTNYAPESRAVYDKTGRFSIYREIGGMRYYQRSSVAEILGGRRTLYHRSGPLLQLADGVLNTYQDIRIALNKAGLPDTGVEEAGYPDGEAVAFLERTGNSGFCRRGEKEFDWIIRHPWILESAEREERYFFSSRSLRFRNICLKIRDSRGGITAFIWLVINGNAMRMPYLALDQDMFPSPAEEALKAVSDTVNHYMQKFRIAYLTLYHEALAGTFSPVPLLKSGSMKQHYFASHELLRQLPEPGSIRFQDGDGDVVFV